MKSRHDWRLTGICMARTFNGLVFMTYAATLRVLQQEWDMSAAAAGSIASGFYQVCLNAAMLALTKFEKVMRWFTLLFDLCFMDN